MLDKPNYTSPEVTELELNELIRIARDRANLSQEDLAKRADISRMTISRYEKGRTIPNCDRLRRIADAVNHPIDYFYQ